MKTGRFVSLADHADAIRGLSDRHDIVLISPHPHMIGEIAGMEALFSIPGLRITSANSYRLLASGRIATLAAISSSLLVEAEFFGVETMRLDPRPPRAISMVRAQALGADIADEIARLVGLDLPDLGGVRLPDGPVLERLLGFNWGLSGISSAADALPALRFDGELPCRLPASHLDFAAGLAYGWYPIEEWGVWGGPLSVYSFAWPANRSQSLVCSLELNSSFPASTGQRVAVWVDGERVASALIPTGEPFKVAFEVKSPVRPGPVQIWLVCKSPWRPCDHDADNLDRRLLGLALLGVEFS